MSALSRISPKDLSRPGISQLVSRASSLAKRASKQKAELDASLTGAEMTAYVQAGAAIQGAIESFAHPDQAGMFSNVLKAMAGIGGVAYGSPEAVAFANGMQAVATRDWVRDALRQSNTPAAARPQSNGNAPGMARPDPA